MRGSLPLRAVEPVLRSRGGPGLCAGFGLKNDDGVVRCGLYDTARAFPKAGQESRGVIARINTSPR